MNNNLITYSLGNRIDDSVDVSICRGHVAPEIFSEAFAREGWSPSEHREEDLKHEYWIENKKGWTKSDKNNPKAEPVTVSYW